MFRIGGEAEQVRQIFYLESWEFAESFRVPSAFRGGREPTLAFSPKMPNDFEEFVKPVACGRFSSGSSAIRQFLG